MDRDIMSPENTQELKFIVSVLSNSMKEHGDTLKSIDRRLEKLVIVEERHLALENRFNEYRTETLSKIHDIQTDVGRLKSASERNHWLNVFMNKWMPLVIGFGIVGMVIVGVISAFNLFYPGG